MDKIKRAIKHELLNIFTALSLEIENLDKSNSENMLNSVKLWSILVWYEDILLGSKIVPINEEFVLNEIIESILLINDDKIKLNSINSNLIKSNKCLIYWDKHYILNALDFLFIILCKSSKSINFNINSINKTLVISHSWIWIKSDNLENCISNNWIDLYKLLTKLVLLIFKQLDININFSSDHILIKFPN